MPSPHRERVFLIRMWRNDDVAAPWRGSVRDVASGKTFYVAGSREMADCVDAALAAPPPPEGSDTPSSRFLQGDPP